MVRQTFSRLLTILALLLLASFLPQGCSLPGTNVKEKKTQVAVMGMIHGGHRTSQAWGLPQVRETIIRFSPDVILTEIPPDRWDRVWSEFQETQTVTDDRVLRFPEYTDAVLHVAFERGFEVEPCAAWTRPMAEHRKKRIKEFETSEACREKREEYNRANAAIESRYSDSIDDEDDPRILHSVEYDRRMKEQLTPYDEYLNDWIGEGGWTNINAAHMALVDEAITAHGGKRILITFGSGHKYWFLEKLAMRDDVEIVSLLPYFHE